MLIWMGERSKSTTPQMGSSHPSEDHSAHFLHPRTHQATTGHHLCGCHRSAASPSVAGIEQEDTDGVQTRGVLVTRDGWTPTTTIIALAMVRLTTKYGKFLTALDLPPTSTSHLVPSSPQLAEHGPEKFRAPAPLRGSKRSTADVGTAALNSYSSHE